MAKRQAKNPVPVMPFKRSDCPLACALDVVGDEWSLLIVRDILFGCSRVEEFLGAGERIPKKVLASKLRDLEKAGIIRKTRSASSPPHDIYSLTDMGVSLSPAIVALVKWGRANILGTRPSKFG
jgi:DNA-binding HxlR family transcriptional regulator